LLISLKIQKNASVVIMMIKRTFNDDVCCDTCTYAAFHNPFLRKLH